MTAAVAYARANIPSADREKDDFYPTPAPAVRALLDRERFTGPIWEPACGDGAISRVLEAAGHEVVSTDLVARGYGEPRVDFLMEHRLLAPNIITNPPFKFAEEFSARSLALGAGKVALLLRLAWLEGISRGLIFASTPLARVHVSSRRLTMFRGGDTGASGGGMLAFAWFIWEAGHKAEPAISWFDWKDFE